MPTSDNQFILGEINATTKAIQKDVAEMRTDLGEVGRRVTAVENRVEAIEAERSVMIPDYIAFVNRVNDHMHTDAQWKSEQEGKAKGATWIVKPAWSLALVIIGSGLTILGRILLGL